jgi:hypothetical protein
MRLLLIVLFSVMILSTNAQSPFQIQLQEKTITNLPGLQSYAFGNYKDLIVIIGGRTDGLHLKQPWRSFHPDYNNTKIYVINPTTNQVWSDSIASLSVELKEQLSSSNMQFAQRDNELIITGGYGFNVAKDDKLSFPAIIVVDLAKLVTSIQKKKAIAPSFHRIADERMAVCGGQLEIINNQFYLIGGHRFDGSYNPKGNATYVQTYTSAIRKFNITRKKKSYSISNFEEIRDTVYLHRRDYNLCPRITPSGDFALSVFSGVFQPGIDMPYRTVVDVDAAGNYSEQKGFMQYYTNYHTANLGIYDPQKKEMHHFFFGGLGEYFLSPDGLITQDSNVPFNKTISHVVRDANGAMKEYALPIEMPGYLGSACSFIPAHNAPFFENGVLDFNRIKGDRMLVGYIIGGITAISPNVFWTNEGDESSASNKVIEVWINKKPEINEKYNDLSDNPLGLEVYTNAMMDEFNIEFTLQKTSDVTIELTGNSSDGQIRPMALGFDELPGSKPGLHMFAFAFDKQIPAGEYMFHITVDGVKKSIRVIVG